MRALTQNRTLLFLSCNWFPASDQEVQDHRARCDFGPSVECRQQQRCYLPQSSEGTCSLQQQTANNLCGRKAACENDTGICGQELSRPLETQFAVSQYSSYALDVSSADHVKHRTSKMAGRTKFLTVPCLYVAPVKTLEMLQFGRYMTFLKVSLLQSNLPLLTGAQLVRMKTSGKSSKCLRKICRFVETSSRNLCADAVGLRCMFSYVP